MAEARAHNRRHIEFELISSAGVVLPTQEKVRLNRS